MSARIIDGKAVADALRQELAQRVTAIKGRHQAEPGLAVVLVGEDPASKVYVANKARLTVEAGMRSFEHKLPVTTSEAELLALVARLNADDAVDGILVQMPLPTHIDSGRVI